MKGIGTAGSAAGLPTRALEAPFPVDPRAGKRPEGRGGGGRMAGRLLAWVLLLGLALAQGVRTSITPGEVEALLKSGSYRYERLEDKGQVYFRLRLAGLRAALYLLDCQEGRCESLQLYAGFSMEKPPTLERINAWNREHRFSRAYLDADGDPALEADLDLSGGVAEGAIRAFLDLFEESLRAFAAWIGFD
jgi:hypothetical protein